MSGNLKGQTSGGVVSSLRPRFLRGALFLFSGLHAVAKEGLFFRKRGLHVGCVGGLALVLAAVGVGRALRAVSNTVGEVDDEPYDHPEGETYPGASVQLHHQVHINEHAGHGEEGQEGDLE